MKAIIEDENADDEIKLRVCSDYSLTVSHAEVVNVNKIIVHLLDQILNCSLGICVSS